MDSSLGNEITRSMSREYVVDSVNIDGNTDLSVEKTVRMEDIIDHIDQCNENEKKKEKELQMRKRKRAQEDIGDQSKPPFRLFLEEIIRQSPEWDWDFWADIELFEPHTPINANEESPEPHTSIQVNQELPDFDFTSLSIDQLFDPSWLIDENQKLTDPHTPIHAHQELPEPHTSIDANQELPEPFGDLSAKIKELSVN